MRNLTSKFGTDAGACSLQVLYFVRRELSHKIFEKLDFEVGKINGNAKENEKFIVEIKYFPFVLPNYK